MSKSGKTPSTPKRKPKSKGSQTKDLSLFAAGVAAAGAAVSKKLGGGKSKGKKVLINIAVALLAVAVLLCGGLYYYDIAPFDFSLDGADTFKFYAYENYEYVVKKPTPGVIAAESSLKVHYIDVGQGDCVFIQLPDGKTMLIDGAKNSSTVASGIIGYLTGLYPGDEKIVIDYVMLTHCDSDHCGSLDDVIASDKIDIKSVYQPKVYSSYENDPLVSPAGNYATITTNVYKNFVKAVYEEKQSGVLDDIYYNLQGTEISGEGWLMRLYNPAESMYAKLSSAKEKNDISPIMVLYFGDIRLLFTGDADNDAEKNFMANVLADLFNDGFDGDVDVLKVAHHGGQESTSAEFLNMVRPEYSIISVGAGNSYGHPRPATLERLAAVGSKVYRTDQSGTVVLCSAGDDITFLESVSASLLIQFDIYKNMSLAINGGYF